MKVQQLRHLIAVADSVSYAQAARRCFTSRQNIVHSIREIESELNVVLFERKGNEVAATAAGQQAVRQARSIVCDVDDLRFMFADQARNGEVVTLAVSMNLFAGIPQATTMYFAGHSDSLRFYELDCEECFKSVCAGRADAAFVMCMERVFPECSSIRVSVSPAFVLVNEASSLADRRSVAADDLLGRHLALMSEPPFQYAALFSQLDALGFNRDSASVISSTSTMLSMVRSYDYVGIVSEKFASNPPRGTVAIPFADQKLNWHFYMLYLRNAQNFETVIRMIQDIRATFEVGPDAMSSRLKNVDGGGYSELYLARLDGRGAFPGRVERRKRQRRCACVRHARRAA